MGVEVVHGHFSDYFGDSFRGACLVVSLRWHPILAVPKLCQATKPKDPRLHVVVENKMEN